MTDSEREQASRHFDLGCMCRKMGRNQEAIAAFQVVVRLDPQNHPAWFNMGNALCDLQDFTSAITCYRNAVAAKPDYDRAWHNMGDAFARRSRFEDVADMQQAVECYRGAVRVKPDKSETWASLGSTLSLMGEIEEAFTCV